MILDELQHTYTIDSHTFKYSVTQLVNQYTPPFQADMIARIVASKEGCEPQDILRKWEVNKEIAQDYGNAVDKAVQYWVDYGEGPKQQHLEEIVEDFKKDFSKNLSAQIAVYDKQMSVCGTIDVVESLGNKKVNVIDVKSNAEFYKKPHGRLLAPFNDLQNNNENKYRIQLSLYRDLLKLQGIEVENLYVWHPVHKIIKLEPINTEEIWKKIQNS